MLTLDRSQHRVVRAAERPAVMASLLLNLDYRFPRRTEIIVEGIERAGRRPASSR